MLEFSAPMMAGVVVAIVAALSVRIVRTVAIRRVLLDIPNERSSHKQPVPRLGGAAFIPIVLCGLLFLAPLGTLSRAQLGAVLAGALLLYAVSLADDFWSLSAGIRFLVQFFAAGIVLWTVAKGSTVPTAVDGELGNGWIGPSSPAYWILALWIVGLLNIYNFMDGIDGIAGIQAVVAGTGWWIVGTHISAPFVAFLGCLIVAGTLGFLTLNWPPAKIFMGDAGSTVIGFLFAIAPLLAWVEAPKTANVNQLGLVAVMVVWPFLADGTFTILRRIARRENILKAHRSHLYQRLVIAGQSHLSVSCIYGALALIGVLTGWAVVRAVPFAAVVGPLVLCLLFLGLWGWVVSREARRGA